MWNPRRVARSQQTRSATAPAPGDRSDGPIGSRVTFGRGLKGVVAAASALCVCAMALAVGEPPCTSDPSPAGAPSGCTLSCTATDRDPACATAADHDTAPTPSAAELGKRVGDALRAATSLRYVEQVTHLGRTVEVRAWMRPDAFRTEAAEHGRTLYAISIFGGQVSEFLAAGGPGVDGVSMQDAEYRYPASEPASIENVNACSRDFGCMIGSNLCTWIGPDSATPGRFERNIARGSEPRRVKLDDGRECFHTQFEVTVGAGGDQATIGHSYFVDPATSMVLRWESFQQSAGEEKVVRVRDYRSISTEPAPADFAWAVSADQFARRAPVAAISPPAR